MTKEQAKQEALKRAWGVLTDYFENGCLDAYYSNHCPDLPESTVKEIATQFQKIIDGIDNRIKPEEVFSLQQV